MQLVCAAPRLSSKKFSTCDPDWNGDFCLSGRVTLLPSLVQLRLRFVGLLSFGLACSQNGSISTKYIANYVSLDENHEPIMVSLHWPYVFLQQLQAEPVDEETASSARLLHKELGHPENVGKVLGVDAPKDTDQIYRLVVEQCFYVGGMGTNSEAEVIPAEQYRQDLHCYRIPSNFSPHVQA